MSEADNWQSLFARPADFSMESADDWFARIANRLLDGCRLRVAGSAFRFTEVEAYYYSEGHLDPFTHRDPVQKHAGRWYFHRTAGVYRSGSFKGVDVTFGDGTNYGGMLIRGIESIEGEGASGESAELVDGPSLTVDHLLDAAGAETVAELDRAIADRTIWDPDNPLYVEWTEPAGRTVYRCGRVGITLRRARSEAATRYVMKPYRFLTEPRRIAKGKSLIIAGLHEAGADAAAIAARIGSPWRTVDRCLKEYAAGMTEKDFSRYSGKDISGAELCRLCGTWKALRGG